MQMLWTAAKTWTTKKTVKPTADWAARRKTREEKVFCPPPPFQEVNHLLILVITNAASTESESSDGREYPVDIWLVLSSYIRPEDVCRFALICRNAWIATCTAVFWTRLYRRSADFTVTSN